MPFPDKEIWAGLAILLMTVAYIPYFYFIFKGCVRPHAFSWLIFFIQTFIAFLVQCATKAGIGAWPTLLSALICLAVCIAGFRTGKKDIHRSDYIALLAALLALAIWYLTNDPLWSIIIIVIVDTAGYFPTFRKAYAKPHEEGFLTFLLMGISNTFMTLAVENPTLTNVLFPAHMAVLDLGLAGYLLWRRGSLKKKCPA
ncbi:MAG: hypothetical protein V1721_06405 [Pseudomonadota bacterium]